MKNKNTFKNIKLLVLLITIIMSTLTACSINKNDIIKIPTTTGYDNDINNSYQENTNTQFNNANIDIYGDVSTVIMPYMTLNNNIPYFEGLDKNYDDFENYSELDNLNRCGVAYANLSIKTMPTEERKNIGNIKPSGWNQEKYPGIVNSNPAYLYNRCHLIGFQLAGENDNKQNLITGTRYFNLNMLPFENQIADYIKKTNNHVLYKVTPIYNNANLVANGVILEALSLEDNGKGICFNVFVFNVQPGICIDYATGKNQKYDNYQDILNIAKELGYLE